MNAVDALVLPMLALAIIIATAWGGMASRRPDSAPPNEEAADPSRKAANNRQGSRDERLPQRFAAKQPPRRHG
jgi:hypothetical protein